ncbi:MAG: glycosyltransferase [Deltaproteobacteria bacterium]|nr:glycosyltransferase [Deltaproteobacteria bacterium]
MSDAGDLVVHLDAALPERLEVGRGQVLHLSGRCYHPSLAIRALAVTMDGVPHAVPNHSSVRNDVPSDDPGIGDRSPNSLTSGFWAAVPVSSDMVGCAPMLACRADLADGTTQTIPLGRVLVVASGVPAPGADGRALARPRIAICLATCNPEPARFAEQVDSILAQTFTNWCCIVADDGSTPDRIAAVRAVAARDPRFRVVGHEARAGQYETFALALAEVPLDAEFVALADQDDVWCPEKLASALGAFGSDTTLVHAGMDAIPRDTARVASRYWTRRNDDADLAALLFANTVTDAASVFRASLLADVLPFPPRIGEPHPGHWIASVALTKGDLACAARVPCVDRPPGANGFGHPARSPRRVRPTFAEVVGLVEGGRLRQRLMAELWRRRQAYLFEVVRPVVMAKVLLLRLGAATAPEKRRMLERIVELEGTPFGVVREGMTALLRHGSPLGAAWRCVLAARLLDAHYRRHRRRLFEQRRARREITGAGPTTSALAGVDLITRKLAPLALRVERDAPRRINLLAPAIDFTHLFGGYLGKLHLAVRLADAGVRVRLVIVDPCQYDREAWRRGIAAYPGLEAIFDRVEVVYAADRDVALSVHPGDGFVATTWWTAYLAHEAGRALGRPCFVYLIQEYEPLTFPMGSLFALAAASYDFPHVPLFSTELLRDYFRRERLGIFAGSTGDSALVFQNAIARFSLTTEALRRSGPRRLLFYARPEQHAARNMFEIGVLALRAAVAGGVFTDEWVWEGIGAGRAFLPVPLGDGRMLRLRPRVSLAEYQALLPAYDVGLALMLTPHPSLVPLEMAAAGLVTVTNTWANKTAEALRVLSRNLVPVPPTLDGVRTGIVEAVRRSDDLAARVAGAEVAWSRDWRTSFDDAIVRGIAAALGHG